MPPHNPSPFNNLQPGRYLFKLPDWDSGYEVQVRPSSAGPQELTVQARANVSPCRLSDVPIQALFLPLDGVPAPCRADAIMVK